MLRAFAYAPMLSTMLLALMGALAFAAIGAPLPFLFGPLFACLICALLGAPLARPKTISVGARTILGVAVGASITPDLIAELPTMALSLAIVPFYILAIALIGVPFFRRVCGFDPVTSFYAAMPGGLQDMVLFGAEAGGDVRALSLIHATRVAIIVTLAPMLITFAYETPLQNPVGAPASTIPWEEGLLMAAAALGGWKIGERVGLFGASIIGPMIATAILSLSGLIHMRPPEEAVLTAQYFIGMGIGVYYVGVTLRELRQVVTYGVAYVAGLAALAFVVAEAVLLSGLAPPLEAFLAFAPGGQAEMTVLAIVAGADLGYVVLHHLTRIVMVITCAPIAARIWAR